LKHEEEIVKRAIVEKDKEIELLLMEFEKICKTNERILSNISKDLESKPRVKYKSHAKGNTNWNKVKKKWRSNKHAK
jgi:hypothetical protein